MGKAAKQQRAAAAAAAAASSSSKSSSSSWTLYGLAAVAVAIAVQAFLLYGSPSTSTTEPEPPPPLPAAVCPPNWPECPRIPGADWVALAALEQEASSAPSREALEAYCSPRELLSQQEVRGMHLFCVLPPDETADGGNATRLVVFSDMNDGPTGPPPSVVALPAGLRTAADAIAALRHTLRLPLRQPAAARRQPAALFSDRGVRIETAAGLLSQRRALLLEGGQWLWPPVHIGHAHVLPDLVAKGVETRVVTKSMKPLVVEIENFLTSAEAVHIITQAKPHLKKSGVALKDADRGKAAKEWRTSSQYFLPTAGDKLLERVDRRVQHLTRIPISHAEYIQVLQYNHLEHYSAHHDFFDPAAYASNAQMLESVEDGAKNRLATVFFYLNNVSSGGETNFPRAASERWPDGAPTPRDYFDCSQGLSVYPAEGKVIIFYSMLPSGEMDELSLHGGCDVLKETETKYSANFWLWNKPYHFLSPARKRFTAEIHRSWL